MRLPLPQSHSIDSLAQIAEQQQQYDLVVMERLPSSSDIFDLSSLLREDGMAVFFLEGDSLQEYVRIERMARKNRFNLFIRKDINLSEALCVTIFCAKKS